MKRIYPAITIVLLAVLVLPSHGETSALGDIDCAPISVTNTGDAGAGSLRQAVADICSGERLISILRLLDRQLILHLPL